MTRLYTMLAIALCCSWTLGCATASPEYYRPRAVASTVDLQQRIEGILQHSRAPFIRNARVDMQTLAFDCDPDVARENAAAVQRSLTRVNCTRHDMKIDLMEIARVEIARPHYHLNLMDDSQRGLLYLAPRTPEEALELIDLLVELRHRLSTTSRVVVPMPLTAVYLR